MTIRTLWNSLLAVLLGTLLAAQAHGQIFVSNFGSQTVGEYDATTGATINASLISGFHPIGIAVSGGNLFVSDASSGTVGEYNATTGATINASLVSGVYSPFGIAVSGGNLFVARWSYDIVGEYDATTGATINASLISGLNYAFGIAVSGGNLFVVNFGSQTVGEYDATTGAAINASLISGLSSPYGIAVSGGHLFVVNGGSGTVGEYDATTGAAINASLISGLSSPYGIAVGELYSAQVQQPINLDGSSVFSVKRGVVPVKFTLTFGGVATCQLPPATISLIRTAGGVLGSIDESTYLSSADSGPNFRIDSTNCQYVYNLAASSLGPGTYTVSISIGGTVIGSGTFGLK